MNRFVVCEMSCAPAAAYGFKENDELRGMEYSWRVRCGRFFERKVIGGGENLVNNG